MSTNISLLIIADNDNDAAIILRALDNACYIALSERIETQGRTKEALNFRKWDAVICDCSLSNYNVHQALADVRAMGCDIPFIVISEELNEEEAAGMMTEGAHDYVMKNNLTRLAHVLRREMAEAKIRGEHRKSVIALKENERKYRRIFETIQDVFYQVDSSGKISEVSPSIAKFYGYSRDGVIGMPVEELYYDPGERHDFLKLISEKGELYDYEIRLKKKDGDVVWASINVHLIYDEAGRQCGIEGLMRDITSRKNAEKLLKESELKYRNVLQTALDGFWIADLNGKILEVNDSYCIISGYSREELLNMNISEIDLIENKSLVIEHIKKIMISGSDRFETVHRTKMGTVRNVVVSSTYYADRLFVFINDITTQKKISSELSRSEEKFRKLFNSLQEGFTLNEIILDKKGNAVDFSFLEVNPAYEKMTGLKDEEIKGKTALQLFPELEKYWIDIYGEVAVTGNAKNIENFSPSLGRYFRVHTFSPERMKFACIVEDITERKQTEEELKKYRNELESLVEQRTCELDTANQRLKEEFEKEVEYKIMLQQSLEKEKELNDLKNRFISTASHEFRTPLATMLSSTELLESYGRKWNEQKYRQHIEKIKTAVDNLTNLVDDVLTISRSESGKLAYSPESLDLRKCCLDLIEEIMPGKKKEHEFIFSYLSKRPFYELDPKLIRYIVTNLLSNAVKYSPEGGKIEFSVSENNCSVLFTISDEGIGIPEEDSNYLFEPFHRGGNTGDIPGTGLGMSIVKRAVDLAGGRINVRKNSPAGTVITVFIPVK